MLKDTKKTALASAVLLLIFIASYINFSSYKPKAIKQVQEVKGISVDTTSPGDFPTPEGSEKVSVSRSTDSEQMTFHTNKSKSEVQDFYKNIFVSNKWTVGSQGTYNDFIITKFVKDNTQISVITYDTQNEYKTLVSVETSKL